MSMLDLLQPKVPKVRYPRQLYVFPFQPATGLFLLLLLLGIEETMSLLLSMPVIPICHYA